MRNSCITCASLQVTRTLKLRGVKDSPQYLLHSTVGYPLRPGVTPLSPILHSTYSMRSCSPSVPSSVRNKECPACRKHCPSRRSLRADHRFDLLVRLLLPDTSVLEQQVGAQTVSRYGATGGKHRGVIPSDTCILSASQRESYFERQSRLVLP